MKLKGKVHKYGANVDTDAIIPARYLSLSEPGELAQHCMEDIDSEFLDKVKPLLEGVRAGSAAQRALAKREGVLRRNYKAMVARLGCVPIDHTETIKVLLCLSRAGLTGDFGRAIIGFLA